MYMQRLGEAWGQIDGSMYTESNVGKQQHAGREQCWVGNNVQAKDSVMLAVSNKADSTGSNTQAQNSVGTEGNQQAGEQYNIYVGQGNMSCKQRA